jgi:thiosulfate/3-mercaptopyruvate sulfurtransferase
MEPEQLNAELGEPMLIIDLCRDANYDKGHIPGAVHVAPAELMDGGGPAPGKLPDKKRLDALATRLGLTPDLPVVVYDDEGGGWAGRMIWTLDVIGHDRWSYLNGGLVAWKGEGYPLETQPCYPEPVPQTVDIDRRYIAEVDDIVPRLEEPDFRVWDARSRAEYEGARSASRRAGHIPGAVHCEWTELMDPSRHYRIREDARDYLADRGLTPDREIVTHCQSHHRSGFTYLVARLMDYPRIRGYHGSWSEWGNRDDTPVATGP